MRYDAVYLFCFNTNQWNNCFLAYYNVGMCQTTQDSMYYIWYPSYIVHTNPWTYFSSINKGWLSAEKGRMAKKTVHVYTVLVRTLQIPQIKEGEGREREYGRIYVWTVLFFPFAISLFRPTTQVSNYSINNSNSQLFETRCYFLLVGISRIPF